MMFQLQKQELAVRQATANTASTRRQYEAAVEQNGRLEARVEAFTFSAQTEQSQLITELRRREDAIRNLRAHHATSEETVGRQKLQAGVFDSLLLDRVSK